MATKPTKKRVRLYATKTDPKHEIAGKYTRVRSDDRYHTSRWTRESRAFRAEHPLCKICLSKGLYVPSEVVDHIIPAAICPDFWDRNNWQALCAKCNIIKGNRDKNKINNKIKK